jgi:dihydroorotase
LSEKFSKKFSKSSLLIKNGRVIDPAKQFDAICDILIDNGIVRAVCPHIEPAARHTIDAANMWVTPGFIDLHTHLREPGFEYKETIKTGALAAVKGGFTTVCAMPNTKPVIDSAEWLKFVADKAKAANYARVLPIASITKNQTGEELVDMYALKQAGAVAFSEDGKSVANAAVMKKALVQAAAIDMPVFDHCEEETLGEDPDAEDLIIARDMLLAESAGARLHICHLSTARGLDLVKLWKKRPGGFCLTAEVCPHHFSLCELDCELDDTGSGNFRMNPPLRRKADMLAMADAVRNGFADAIATDHAPHSLQEKRRPNPLNGIVGLETALALCLDTFIYRQNPVAPIDLIAMLTVNPAKILGIKSGAISPGAPADICIIDPDERWTVNPSNFVSMGKNTPYAGRTLRGVIKYTLVNGEIKWQN